MGVRKDMTLTGLARRYVAARRSLIGEFSGDIRRDLKDLRVEVVEVINPLLERHGADPVPPEDYKV